MRSACQASMRSVEESRQLLGAERPQVTHVAHVGRRDVDRARGRLLLVLLRCSAHSNLGVVVVLSA
jgi:hypothetical protein